MRWDKTPAGQAFHKERYKKLKYEFPEYQLWIAAKSRAKKENIPFDIEVSDIIIPFSCPILGLILEIKDGPRRDNSPSLDKIDPERGYTKGNVQVISWRANNLKRDATQHELEMFAKYFYQNYLSEMDF